MRYDNPLVFLIDTLFSLYAFAFLLRFLLQLVRADFHNPISQGLVMVTSPVLKPLRRVIPGLRGIDLACLLAMFAVKLLGLALAGLAAGRIFPVSALLLNTAYDLVDLALLTFFITIIIQVILSWVNPHAHNPITALLHQLNAPLLRPVRRLVPPLGGLDLSPLFVLIGIQFLRMTLRWLIFS